MPQGYKAEIHFQWGTLLNGWTCHRKYLKMHLSPIKTILLQPIFFLYVLNKMSFILNRNDKITQNILFGKCLEKGQNLIPNTCESSQLLAWHSDFLKDNSNRIKFYLVVFVYLFLTWVTKTEFLLTISILISNENKEKHQ